MDEMNPIISPEKLMRFCKDDPSRDITEADFLSIVNFQEMWRQTNDSSYCRKRLGKPLSATWKTERVYEEYRAARAYACSSIINSLYPLGGLTSDITTLDCATDHFYLLARVRTNWEAPTIEQTADLRTFLGFSLLSERNLSHFPGRVLYGYYTDVTPDMIAHICPYDADTISYMHNRFEVSAQPEQLLDAEDLLLSACEHHTYSQLTIRSKNGSRVLRPDCIIAIDEISSDDRLAREKYQLPILLIHRSPNTLYHVKDQYSYTSCFTKLARPHNL